MTFCVVLRLVYFALYRHIEQLALQGNNLTGNLDDGFCDIADFMVDCVDTYIFDDIPEADILLRCDCCRGCMWGYNSCASA
jgi:hypothetical protein